MFKMREHLWVKISSAPLWSSHHWSIWANLFLALITPPHSSPQKIYFWLITSTLVSKLLWDSSTASVLAISAFEKRILEWYGIYQKRTIESRRVGVTRLCVGNLSHNCTISPLAPLCLHKGDPCGHFFPALGVWLLVPPWTNATLVNGKAFKVDSAVVS